MNIIPPPKWPVLCRGGR